MRRRIRWLLHILALAGAAAATSPAGAQIVGPGIPLGSPSYAVSCSGAQDSAHTDRSCGAGNSSASVTLGPTPNAQAQATYPGDLAMVPSSASANLSYVFTVIGGEYGAAVPLGILMTLAAASGGPNSYAFANVKVTTNLGVVSQTICTYGCGAGDGIGNFTGVLPMFAGVGSIGLVEMTAVAANGLSLSSLSASALADPYIYIDPTFADAARYAVIVSPGVGNRPLSTSDAVPEPAAWALMIAGFGLVGATARHRRCRVGYRAVLASGPTRRRHRRLMSGAPSRQSACDQTPGRSARGGFQTVTARPPVAGRVANEPGGQHAQRVTARRYLELVRKRSANGPATVGFAGDHPLTETGRLQGARHTATGLWH